MITGASGFLGRHLTALLEDTGLSVRPVSRRPLFGMHLVQDYSETPAGDVLIHLAELADRAEVNRLGQRYVTRAASVLASLSRSYERIIYASSGVVYGDEREFASRVDAPVLATDAYSESKLLNERIALDSGGTVVRLSNLFGIGMAKGNVMSEILHQIPKAGTIHVRDDKPVRDYLHVDEAAVAISMLLERPYDGIVNVGSGIGTSVRTLAELILSLAGQTGREIVATAPSTRRSITVLDISDTAKLLGWTPRASLETHLAPLLP